jgi:hypothetical protein
MERGVSDLVGGFANVFATPVGLGFGGVGGDGDLVAGGFELFRFQGAEEFYLLRFGAMEFDGDVERLAGGGDGEGFGGAEGGEGAGDGDFGIDAGFDLEVVGEGEGGIELADFLGDDGVFFVERLGGFQCRGEVGRGGWQIVDAEGFDGGFDVFDEFGILG